MLDVFSPYRRVASLVSGRSEALARGLGGRRRRLDCLPMVGVALFDYVANGPANDAGKLLLVNGLRNL